MASAAALVSAGCNCPGFGGRSIALFDGEDTSGWRGYKQQHFPTNQWVIDNGALKTVPGRAIDLVTRERFKDFDLSFEWKVPPGGNSGVMYNVDELGSAPWHSGPEYQIVDDVKHPDGRNPKTSAGSLYALIAPNDAKTLKPVGEWNHSRIVVKDARVEHWLNGAKVLEYEWNSPSVRAEVKRSKFNEHATFMGNSEGHIVFQHHGEEVWFRNIRVKRL
ncbi:MAG: DUF1080 domain-containing protein [Verrucomicrobia subdivision 3 bacterium]|nr:DUF1080 domain-containing protein [Limisphaerales bacterium]